MADTHVAIVLYYNKFLDYTENISLIYWNHIPHAMIYNGLASYVFATVSLTPGLALNNRLINKTQEMCQA